MAELAASTSAAGPGQQDITDVHDVPSTSCTICMSERLQNPTKIQVCGHCFCLGCIRQWSRTSPEPRCPLCNASFNVLVHDSTEEELPISAGKQAAIEADLGCLDHAYFRAETRRLLSRAKAAQQAVYRDSHNCGRVGSAESAQAFGTLDDVIVSLNSYRYVSFVRFRREPLGSQKLTYSREEQYTGGGTVYNLNREPEQHREGSKFCSLHPLTYTLWCRSSMEEEVPFEAQHVLQELYSLDAVVGGVQAGNWERNAVQSAPRRYTADDAETMSDDDDMYDDYTYDHVGSSSNAQSHSRNAVKGVARTPGRAPPHRNQRRPRHGHEKR